MEKEKKKRVRTRNDPAALKATGDSQQEWVRDPTRLSLKYQRARNIGTSGMVSN